MFGLRWHLPHTDTQPLTPKSQHTHPPNTYLLHLLYSLLSPSVSSSLAVLSAASAIHRQFIIISYSTPTTIYT